MPLRLKDVIESGGQFAAQETIHDDVGSLTEYRII